MTVKQINAEIKSHKRDLAEAIKNRDEGVREGIQHYVRDCEKWIAYHQKRIDALVAALPAAVKAEEEKMLKKIAKEQIKNKASSIKYLDNGSGHIKGITPNGLHWEADLNWHGVTDRCLHCFALYIEGKGCVFTSGTLDSVLMTVAQN